MKAWIRLHLQFSYNEMERMAVNGWCSTAQWMAWCAVWDWSAPRFCGSAGLRHDAYYTRHGGEAYLRKINRVRAAFGLALYESKSR